VVTFGEVFVVIFVEFDSLSGYVGRSFGGCCFLYSQNFENCQCFG